MLIYPKFRMSRGKFKRWWNAVHGPCSNWTHHWYIYEAKAETFPTRREYMSRTR